MRDDKGGALSDEGIEGLLDGVFGYGVHAGGGFIEDHEGGGTQDDAGDGEALFFTLRQADAALTDHGIHALGQRLDEVPSRGGLQGFRQSGIRGAGFGEAKVVGDGAVEKEGFLGDESDVLAQVV